MFFPLFGTSTQHSTQQITNVMEGDAEAQVLMEGVIESDEVCTAFASLTNPPHPTPTVRNAG